MRGYVICCSARSGSTYFRELLTSTGVLGRPHEYFNTEAMRRRVSPDYPEDPELQLAGIVRLSATSNGVYGLKVHPWQFDAAASTRWAERLPHLAFVYLQRRDLLGQAISKMRAQQTGQWDLQRAGVAEPSYDAAAISRELVSLAQEEARWRYYFGRNGLSPLHLIYEDVVADPPGAVDALAALMQLDEPATIDPAQIRLGIQRDGLSEAWRERFISEFKNLAVFN